MNGKWELPHHFFVLSTRNQPPIAIFRIGSEQVADFEPSPVHFHQPAADFMYIGYMAWAKNGRYRKHAIFMGNMIIKKMEFGSVLFGFNRKVCFSPLTPSCTHVQNMWIWTASTSNGDRLPKNRSGEFWNDLSDTCEVDHLRDLLCSASEGLSLGRLGRCRQIQKQAGSRKTYTALMGNREEDE